MKLRRCVVCNQYTLSLMHCNKPTVKAHPPAFKNIRYLKDAIDCNTL